MSRLKICCLFGAGAEDFYNLPLGPQFTLETILRKRLNLYEALSIFYKERKVCGYCDNYKKIYMFTRDSNTFNAIIHRAAIKCREKNQRLKNIEPETVKLIQSLDNDEIFKQITSGEVFDAIIHDHDEVAGRNETSYPSLLQHLSYYGTIEKDFSTLINPKEAGIDKFWRLVNYFWGAYFSIMFPILENSTIYSVKLNYYSNKTDKYSFVLDRLNEITQYLYSSDFSKYNPPYSGEKRNGDYYKALKKSDIEISYAITTNYTPFVADLGLKNEEVSFLAGQLKLFELPHLLSVKALDVKELYNDEFVFPYLFTQAPVKPIVEPTQIKEFSKALNFLNEINVLVIIGYGLNCEDNHINAMLRDYVLKADKNLIYCKYYTDEIISKEIIKDDIINKLKLRAGIIREKEFYEDNIKVILHSGNPTELLYMLKAVIDNI